MIVQPLRPWPWLAVLTALVLGACTLSSSTACEKDASSRVVKTFQEYINLNAEFVRAVRQGPSPTGDFHQELRNAVEAYHETKLLPALEDATRLVCERGDREVLSWFMRLVVADANSASEAPTWTFGEIFLCRSALVAELHAEFSPGEQEFLIAQLKLGIRNVMYGRPEDEIRMQFQGVDSLMHEDRSNQGS